MTEGVQVGSAYVALGADASGLQRDLQKGESAVRGWASKLSGIFTVAGAGLTAGVTAPLLMLGNKAIDQASDVAESMNKVNVVFGNSAKSVEAFAKTSATSIGMAKGAALDAAGTLGNMYVQLGVGAQEAAKFSTQMLTAAADMASFHNAAGGAEEVMVAIQAAFRGEYDAMQRYIPTINAAAVEQMALAMTGKESAKALTAQEKALAAQAIIMRDMGPAAGDFLRTMNDGANATRIMEAQITDLTETIGGYLLPIKLQLVQTVQKLLSWFQRLRPETQKLIVVFGGIAAAAGPVLLALGAVMGAIAAIGAPVLLLVGGLAALGVAFATNFGGIRDTVMGAIGPVLDTLKTFWEYIRFAAEEGDYLNDFLVDLPLAMRPVAEAIGRIVGGVSEAIEKFSLMRTEGATLFGALRGAVDEFLSIWSGLDRVGPQGGVDIATALWNGMHTWWDTNGLAWASTTLGKIGAALGSAATSLLTWAGQLWNGLHSWWDTNGAAWAATALGKIGAAISSAATTAVTWAGTLWNGLLTWWDTSAGPWAATALSKIGTAISAAAVSAVSFAGNIWNTLLTWWDTSAGPWAATALSKIGAAMSTTATTALTWAASLWNGLLTWWDGNGSAWAGTTLQKIGSAIGGALTSMGAWVSAFWKQLGDWWTTAESAGMMRASAVAILASLNKALLETIPNMEGAWAEALGTKMAEQLAPAIGRAFSAENIGTAIAAAIGVSIKGGGFGIELETATASIADRYFESLITGFEKTDSKWSILGVKIEQALLPMLMGGPMRLLPEMILKLRDDIVTTIDLMEKDFDRLTSIPQKLSDAFSGANADLTTWGDGLRTSFEIAVDSLGTAWTEHWAAVWEGIQRDFGSDKWAGAASGIVTGLETVWATLSGWQGKFNTWAYGILGAIAIAFGKIGTTIKTAIGSVDLSEIGANLVRSLANSIKSTVDSYLKPIIDGISSAIPAWMRKILGMASPSRVFADIGRQIIEGLALGLSESEQVAIDALAKVFENVISFVEALTMISGYRVNTSLTTNLTSMIDQVKQVVTELSDLAGWLVTPGPNGVEPYINAKAGTDALRPIVDNVRAMAETMMIIAGYKLVGDVTSIVDDMVQGYKTITLKFSDFAKWLVSPDGLGDQDQLADAVGALSVMAMVSDSFGVIFATWSAVAKAGNLTGPKNMAAMLDSIVEMMKQVVTKLDELKLDITDELIDFAGRLADLAGAFGDIAKTWETVSKFEWSKLDMPKVVEFLKDFAGQVMTALDEVSKTAPAVGENWQAFLANVKGAIALIADVAKAWETISDFQPNAKLNVETVVDWLASLAGLATKAIERVQAWGGITPNETFNAFVTAVKGAIGLIADTAKAWETLGKFQWNTKLQMDGENGVVNWLAALAGLATRAIEKVQAWGGITPNETFNAFVTSVKAAIGLIVDTAKAWESIQDFKPNNRRLDMNAVVDWLASLGGLALRALEGVQKWSGITPDEAFTAFTTAIKNSLGALSEALKFTSDLGLWKHADNVRKQMQALTADIKVIVDELWLTYINMRGFVNDSLLKFVADISALTGGLATVVDLLKSIEDLSGTGDITFAVARIRDMITSLLTGLKDIVLTIDESERDLIQNFSEAVSDLMGAIRDAVLVALELPKTWVTPSDDMLLPVIDWMLHVFTLFDSAITRWFPDTEEEAKKWPIVLQFAQAVGAVLSAIRDAALLAFELPKVWVTPPDDTLLPVIDWMMHVFKLFETRLGQWFPNTEEEAKKWPIVLQFAQAVGTVLTAIRDAALLAFELPKTWVTPPDDTLLPVIDWMMHVFKLFETRLGDWFPDTEEEAKKWPVVVQFAQAVGTVLTAIKDAALLAFELPKTWVTPADTIVKPVIDWMIHVFQMFQAAVLVAFPDTAAEAKVWPVVVLFAQSVGTVLTAIRDAALLALELPKTWVTPANTVVKPVIDWMIQVFQMFQAAVLVAFPDTAAEAKVWPTTVAFAQAVGTVLTAIRDAALLAFDLPKTWVAPADSIVKPVIDWMIHVFGLFQTAVLAAFPDTAAEAKVWPVVVAFASAVGTVLGAIKTALDVALAIPTTWTVIPTGAGSPYASLITFMQKVGADFAAYVAANMPKDSAAAANMPVVKAFAEALGAVMGALGTALDVMKGLQGYIPLLNSRITDFIGSVTFAYGLVKTYATGAGVAAGTAATKAFAEATSAVFSALTAALGLFKALVEPGNGLTASVDDFKTRLSSLVSRISIVLGAWKTYVETEANSTWTPVSQAFKNKIDGVFGTLRTALDLFKDLNTAGMPSPSAISAFLTQVLGLFSSFVAGIGVAPTQVGTAASGVKSTLTAWSNTLSQDAWTWYNVGYAFGGMLAAGWKVSMENQVKAGSFMMQSTIAVTDAIKAAIKKAFGIASPSTVMQGFGMNVAAGLGLGMLGGLPDVQAAARSLYEAAQPGMNLGGSWDVNNSRVITVRFEGQAGGGVPLSPQQFSALKGELAYAIRIGA